jgi:hypothetical protein
MDCQYFLCSLLIQLHANFTPFARFEAIIVVGISDIINAVLLGGQFRIAQLILQLTTGWTFQGLNPGRDEIFCTCPDWPEGPCSLYTMGTGSPSLG